MEFVGSDSKRHEMRSGSPRCAYACSQSHSTEFGNIEHHQDVQGPAYAAALTRAMAIKMVFFVPVFFIMNLFCYQ